jgi:hypothetical protein
LTSEVVRIDDQLEADHVIPLSKGGGHLGNLGRPTDRATDARVERIG